MKHYKKVALYKYWLKNKAALSNVSETTRSWGLAEDSHCLGKVLTSNWISLTFVLYKNSITWLYSWTNGSMLLWRNSVQISVRRPKTDYIQDFKTDDILVPFRSDHEWRLINLTPKRLLGLGTMLNWAAEQWCVLWGFMVTQQISDSIMNRPLPESRQQTMSAGSRQIARLEARSDPLVWGRTLVLTLGFWLRKARKKMKSFSIKGRRLDRS